VKVGLVGTGHWARVTHAAGLVGQPDIELAGIWGRDPSRAAALAADVGSTPYDDVDRMLEQVDAVSFSVPPQVQVEIALRAAAAGKHLLLEKPIATTSEDAAKLADAVQQAGVASVVFFTSRFEAARRAWVNEVAQRQDWESASCLWLGSAFAAGSPFDTPWRHDKGGLWDVGPHALSLLTGVLGRIVGVSAHRGSRDLVHLVLRHESGKTSTAGVSIDTPEAAARTCLTVWGPAGRSEMPEFTEPPSAALSTAVHELAAAAQLPNPVHPCDVHLGREVVDLLAEAERQIMPEH
jgi:predicted dehydrogenase